MSFASYAIGTVSVSAGGTVVTGVGTVWSGVNVRPGDVLQIGAFQTIIADVTDTTHLAIPTWGGGNQSSVAYTIYQSSPLRFAGGQAMADVASLISTLAGRTFYTVIGASPTADGLTASEGQYALKTNTTRWSAWLWTSGAWVLQGAPVGVSYRSDINGGVWLISATYAVGDMVTLNGALYISNIASNTGYAPESNPTQWAVASSAGINGSTWSAGTGAPSGGKDGDFYLNSSTDDIYLRSSGTWSVLVNIKGAMGNTGSTGATGAPATVAINSVTALAPGSTPTVTNSGTPSSVSLNFGIPTGLTGTQGPTGLQGVGLQPDASGTFAQRAAYDGQTTGYKFLETDVSPFRLYVKASNTSADWAGPTYIGGNFPVGDMGHITDSIIQTFDFGHIV